MRVQPKCPSITKWISKMWYIHAMEHYSVINRDAAAWISLGNMMLNETRQMQRAVQEPNTMTCPEWQVHGDRKQTSGCQGLQERWWEWLSTAMGFFWVGDKNILESDSGDGGITLWIYLKLLKCTLLKKGTFYIVNDITITKEGMGKQESPFDRCKSWNQVRSEDLVFVLRCDAASGGDSGWQGSKGNERKQQKIVHVLHDSQQQRLKNSSNLRMLFFMCVDIRLTPLRLKHRVLVLLIWQKSKKWSLQPEHLFWERKIHRKVMQYDTYLSAKLEHMLYRCRNLDRKVKEDNWNKSRFFSCYNNEFFLMGMQEISRDLSYI